MMGSTVTKDYSVKNYGDSDELCTIDETSFAVWVHDIVSPQKLTLKL